jgi:hypothetical protein
VQKKNSMMRDVHADVIDGTTLVRHLNRIKGKATNKAAFWCAHCDHAKVGQVGKCPCCRKRQGTCKRTFRTIDPADLELAA